MKRLMALGAAVAALGAGSAALGYKAVAGGATAAQNDGGLSLLPALVQRGPQPGPIATYTITNRSAAPLAVQVTPRPWVQDASGKVSVNRRARLRGVSVDASSFTLGPGERRDVTATLTSAPSGGSLFGALEAIGLPTDAEKRNGVVLGYRLIGTIRIVPSSPRHALRAGTPKATRGTAVVPVRNRGNTVDPVSGSIRLRGVGGSRSRSVQGIRILPGKTVNVSIASKLQRGSYTATLRLTQRNRVVLRATKRFRVR